MFRALAPRLRAKGWRALIPLVPGEKRPIMKGWERFNETAPSDALISAWCAAYPDAGIGKAAGPDGTIDVDLDFIDPPIASAATTATQSILGKSPLIRQGRKPKSLHIYRLAPDVIIPGRSFGGFECFTRSGQIVMFGQHPETMRPYEWIGGATPSDVGPNELPIVTGDQVCALLAELQEIAHRDPTRTKRATRQGAASDRASGYVSLVAADLREADDPLAAAAEIIRRSAAGDRHPKMVGSLIWLADRGYSDDEITAACAEAYVSKFAGADGRAADFARAIAWARAQIGPDHATIGALPWAKSLAAKWRCG